MYRPQIIKAQHTPTWTHKYYTIYQSSTKYRGILFKKSREATNSRFHWFKDSTNMIRFCIHMDKSRMLITLHAYRIKKDRRAKIRRIYFTILGTRFAKPLKPFFVIFAVAKGFLHWYNLKNVWNIWKNFWTRIQILVINVKILYILIFWAYDSNN